MRAAIMLGDIAPGKWCVQSHIKSLATEGHSLVDNLMRGGNDAVIVADNIIDTKHIR